MMRAKLSSTLCVTAIWLAAAPIHAQPDAFWCGTHLIREGMRAEQIVERCGQPDTVEVLEEPIMARRQNGSRFQVGVKTTEFWTYDRGTVRFPARVTIEEGVATEVALLSGN